MRSEALLPNVSHLTYSLSNTDYSLYELYGENVSTPFGLWNGVRSIYFYAGDAKAGAAIINGN
jgi:hypothetical protein